MLAMILVPSVNKYLNEARLSRAKSGAKLIWETSKLVEVEGKGEFVDYEERVQKVRDAANVKEPTQILIKINDKTREVLKVAYTRYTPKGNEPMVSFDGVEYEILEGWGLN